MPDLNDFYAFKMTSGGSSSGRGKNNDFGNGGVDGCDCDEILSLIAEGKIDTTPLITHRFALKDIEKAYNLLENNINDGTGRLGYTFAAAQPKTVKVLLYMLSVRKSVKTLTAKQKTLKYFN